MNRIFQYFSALIIILVTIYIIGPVEKFTKVNNDPLDLNLQFVEVDNYIRTKEFNTEGIKKFNEAQILWTDSTSRTEFAFVYLHGFTASHKEGYPIIQHLAYRYQCNTFLSRLAGHGLENIDAHQSLTPEKYIHSAKEAVAIGKIIGKKVILVSTSTGSTLSIYLAAEDPAIAGLIMLSPNIDLFDPMSRLLTKPWGKQLLRMIYGGNYHQWEGASDYANRYWTSKNHINGIVALRELLNQTMTNEVFKQISIPYFIAYYYKDDENRDKVISLDAIQQFSMKSNTAKDKKTIKPFSNAPGHVIGCFSLNPAWEDVQDEIYRFVEEKMGLLPIYEL